MTESQRLYDTVIKNGYCIGCGSCAAVAGTPFSIEWDAFGKLVAVPQAPLSDDASRVLDICPFSDVSESEDTISEALFSSFAKHDKEIGYYLKCFAGHVVEGPFRDIGTSGGLGKWIGYSLLKEGKVDYLCQVIARNSQNTLNPMFDYQVFSNCDQVPKGAKSAYHPVTLVEVIKIIKQYEGRYAITGVPCFIKALRLLAKQDEVLRKRIAFTVGVVCGSMKSANYAKFIGWQHNVLPKHLAAIDFRKKNVTTPANHQESQVWSSLDDVERCKPNQSLFGLDYGMGLFKPKACDYCDDVVGETADVSLGDAWLPEYTKDPYGTSIIIVRNPILLQLIERARSEKKLRLDVVSVAKVIQSQSSGLRHRREGLSFRLAQRANNSEWIPRKRIQPGQYRISEKRRVIYSLREQIANESHKAFVLALVENDISVFVKKLRPLVLKYKRANRISLWARGVAKARRLLAPSLS